MHASFYYFRNDRNGIFFVHVKRTTCAGGFSLVALSSHQRKGIEKLYGKEASVRMLVVKNGNRRYFIEVKFQDEKAILYF